MKVSNSRNHQISAHDEQRSLIALTLQSNITVDPSEFDEKIDLQNIQSYNLECKQMIVKCQLK